MENPKDTEKDHFTLYLVLATIVLVAAFLLVNLNENEKFAPIKQQLDEESQQMHIRVIREYED